MAKCAIGYKSNRGKSGRMEAENEGLIAHSASGWDS